MYPSFPLSKENETGLARIDADLRLQDYSPFFAQVVGVTTPGLPLAEVLPVFAGVEDWLRQMRQRGPRIWELRFVHHIPPDGSEPRYLDLSIAVDETGEGWHLSARDVTAAAERLHQEVQRFNDIRIRGHQPPAAHHLMRRLGPGILVALWEHLGLMLAVVDANLIIEAVTPPTTMTLQRPLIGLPLTEVLPTLAGLEGELQRIVRGEAAPWRLPGLQLDPELPQHWDILFIPRTDAAGLLIIVQRTVNETLIEQELRQQRNELTLLHKELEAQAMALRTANERLVNLDRERRALMALIVGDIKSALSVIGGYSEWLTRPASTAIAFQQEAVVSIREAVAQIDRLLDRVMTIERLENKLVQLQRTPCDVHLLLEEAVVMRQEHARMQHLDLQIELPERLPPVSGDAQVLAEGFGRLLDYAIGRAIPSARIEVSSRVWKEWVLVEVTVGIPGRPEQAAVKALPSSSQHVFELTQVRLVVESHDGHLALEETKNGLQLVVWLPLAGEAKDRSNVTVDRGKDDAMGLGQYEPLVVAGGTLRLDRTRRQAWLYERPLLLTPLEYRLLVYLAQHRDRVIGHKELLAVLGHEEGEMSLNHLRVLIARLRNKLGDSEEASGILRTVRGVGYTLAS
ncbi:MAG: winged helix-turn-helix domain-containing protein [Caldilineales bacterium]|nr:winged helix-turn-helix domain-containing protein [Caldilineales bacterium]